MEKEDERESKNKKAEGKPNHPVGSELRQDIITGDWVVIATGRAKRPEEFSEGKRDEADTDIENCLFCDPEKTGQEEDVLIYRREDDEWTLRVFPNKFPAFSKNTTPKMIGEGPYYAMTGAGFHEIVVTRNHVKHIALLEEIEIAEVFDAYQSRYLDLMNKKSVNYISIFHNHGNEAGASIAHPHSQIMAIPVISPYVELELRGAEEYYRANRNRVFDIVIDYESENKKRVIFENSDFIAFCPYSSRAAFEVWVIPKKISPYFERITDKEKMKLAEVFKKAMKGIYDALNDPAYNFYIHTSPCDGNDYPYYRWHIEIIPRTSIWAGFELETGIEISTIQPEVAAKYLRSKIES